ncbi:MAG: glycoside hydrolase family 3 C-terminal domain-containing protein [Anaerolineae bacterium]
MSHAAREQEIAALVEQMTTEEKISLLAGADFWHTVPVPRLGIPSIKVTDGPVGARGKEFMGGPSSACFPCGTALAATWDPAMVERVGRALAEEVRAKGAHILLAPTVNIHRSPLAGRNFECYSEDPYLTARMASAYISGLQGAGVGACIKHFVGNDSEFERMSMSSEIAERPLREIYLRPFELAVRDVQPWAVMSSYNRVNGTYACESDTLLIDILKGEWGFDGIIMSDWFGTYSPNVSRGGLDLEMPGPARWMGKHAAQAVESGALSHERLNDKVRRLLRTIARVGAFEHPDLQPEQGIDRPEHHAVAREAASEAIVLLKNDKSFLPLDLAKLASIAVVGRPAAHPAPVGGGSAQVNPHYLVTPLHAIEAKAGEKVVYAPGPSLHKIPPHFDMTWFTNGVTVEYFTNRDLSGTPAHTGVEKDLSLSWLAGLSAAEKASGIAVRVTGSFVVPETGDYEISLSSFGQARMSLDEHVVTDRWERPFVFGDVGEKAVFHLSEDEPHTLTVECAPQLELPFPPIRLGGAMLPATDAVAEAAKVAAKADVAIVFVGLTTEWETEGVDRENMELPNEQARLIEAVSAANPNTVVVINAGAPISMRWLGSVPAVLQTWYLGQETGNAVTDVLFGDVNPSGKLPTTFPVRLEDNPAFINYPGENGKVLYGEGLFVGYRYYDKKDVTPLFPFGHGLSYTTFEYRNLHITPAGDGALVSVDVQNTGSRAGAEVVQVYVRDVASRLVRPDKELKAFARVELAPGETKTVDFTLDQDALAYYDPSTKAWVVEPGEFEVLVGASSRDIRQTGTFTIG